MRTRKQDVHVHVVEWKNTVLQMTSYNVHVWFGVKNNVAYYTALTNQPNSWQLELIEVIQVIRAYVYIVDILLQM